MVQDIIVTKDALIIASLSLYGTDQAMLNAGIASVVYSNAIGASEGTLNFVNADTIADDKLRAEIQNQKDKNDDGIDIALGAMSAMALATLERIRDGQVTYANGQFNIGGLLVDEEDMDTVIDNMVEGFDGVVAKHDLDAEQSSTLYALLLAYQAETDPQLKAQILEDIKTDVSPELAVDMAREANKLQDAKAERDMSADEIRVQANAAPTDYDESPFGDTPSSMSAFNESAGQSMDTSIAIDANAEIAAPKPIGFEA